MSPAVQHPPLKRVRVNPKNVVEEPEESESEDMEVSQSEEQSSETVSSEEEEEPESPLQNKATTQKKVDFEGDSSDDSDSSDGDDSEKKDEGANQSIPLQDKATTQKKVDSVGDSCDDDDSEVKDEGANKSIPLQGKVTELKNDNESEGESSDDDDEEEDVGANKSILLKDKTDETNSNSLFPADKHAFVQKEDEKPEGISTDDDEEESEGVSTGDEETRLLEQDKTARVAQPRATIEITSESKVQVFKPAQMGSQRKTPRMNVTWDDEGVTKLLEAYMLLKEEQSKIPLRSKVFYETLSERIGGMLDVKPNKDQVKEKVYRMKNNYRAAAKGTLSQPISLEIQNLCKKAFADKVYIEPDCSSARGLLYDIFDSTEETRGFSNFGSKLACYKVEEIEVFNKKLVMATQQLDMAEEELKSTERAREEGGD